MKNTPPVCATCISFFTKSYKLRFVKVLKKESDFWCVCTRKFDVFGCEKSVREIFITEEKRAEY